MTPMDTALAEHKRLDAASYDAAAGEFDRLTGRLAAPLARETLALARLGPADRVLDVGTGTGLVAPQAAAALRGGGGSVVGIDHSEGLLRKAAGKARRRGLEAMAEFRRMDAEALELDGAGFDAVVSLFVPLHLPGPAAAVREMRRVLKPGGRLVVGVGRGPRLASRAGVVQAARRVAAEVGAARGRLVHGLGAMLHTARCP